MGKTISFDKLSETITLTEQTDGWWLYDYTRGMNLGMREESKDKALIKAITYYQRRLSEVEQKQPYIVTGKQIGRASCRERVLRLV